MNRRDKDVLLALSIREYAGQRDLANACTCSLGAVNASVRNLLTEEYIDRNMHLTEKSRNMLRDCAPERAVLLAAGFGLRSSPLNAEKPKPLLEVRGEPLIERIICQLHEVGIFEIYVVVGFAKEKFEYLIDKYGIELIVNSDYAKKNNLHSLALARDHLKNSYIVPCDMWCRENPFRRKELYSWYMVSDAECPESSVRVNRKQELAVVSPESNGNAMIGISYLHAEDADIVRERLCKMDFDRRYKGSFWEETLYEKDKLRIGPRTVKAGDVVEINSYEEQRELDSQKLIPISEIARILGVSEQELIDIAVIKKGMTNRSFSFVCRGERYILRIPDDKLNDLVDRGREADVYGAISGYDISDEVIYLDRNTGLKISKCIEAARPCDPRNERDAESCMQLLRRFHNMRLTVEHEFDLFGVIDYFESLWGDIPSVYPDYEQTKKDVFSLRSYIDAQKKDRCLTHIDAVPENFLIPCNDADRDGIRLIDWEYAAMQDPHLDIAMYCLYSLYNKHQVDHLISAYFTEGCSDAVRLKIYCYIAAGGLLWSNWCEYKCRGGTEFGEYSLRQYRYAKDYFRIVQKELGS